MIEKSEFEALKTDALTKRHSSFAYLEYESVAAYTRIASGEGGAFLRGRNEAARMRELHWASDEPEQVIDTIKEEREETLVSFVPEEWNARFLSAGLKEYARLREYWIYSLEVSYRPKLACAPIGTEEADAAARVTQACRLQSRAFFGETKESILQWIAGENPDANASGCRYATVIACRFAGEIAGVVLTGVYGFGGKRGPIAWVREVAVMPEYQGRGYGCALVESALDYGLAHGAENAFLMADDCNARAVSLYRGVGFRPNGSDVQIDMTWNP